MLVELHWPGPDTGEGALFGLMRGFHAWGFRVFHREPNVANVQRCWEFAMAKVFFALLHSCAYSLVCLLFYNIFAVPFASLQTLVGCILAVTNYSCCFKQFDAFTLLLVFVCKVAAVNKNRTPLVCSIQGAAPLGGGSLASGTCLKFPRSFSESHTHSHKHVGSTLRTL